MTKARMIKNSLARKFDIYYLRQSSLRKGAEENLNPSFKACANTFDVNTLNKSLDKNMLLKTSCCLQGFAK